MSIMRSTETVIIQRRGQKRLDPRQVRRVVRRPDLKQRPLGCNDDSYYDGLGALPVGAQAGLQVAATAANFIPVVGPVIGGIISVFGKIFGGGKSKAQKKAESMQRRTARAAGTMQAVANVLVNYPNSVENRIMSKLNQLFTTGGGGDWAIGAPCEVIEAFASIDPNTFGKKRAIAAMQSYQAGARDYITTSAGHKCFYGKEWWDKYLSGQLTSVFGPVDPGYQRLAASSKPYSGPVIDISGRWLAGNQKVTVIQAGSNFIATVEGGGSFNGKFTDRDKLTVDAGDLEATGSATISSISWDGGISWQRDTVVAIATPVSQGVPDRPGAIITPTGGGPIVSATPTSDGQAQIVPVQPIQAGIGGLGWLAAGGLLLMVFGGKPRSTRRRRPARGTTVIRRY